MSEGGREGGREGVNEGISGKCVYVYKWKE